MSITKIQAIDSNYQGGQQFPSRQYEGVCLTGDLLVASFWWLQSEDSTITPKKVGDTDGNIWTVVPGSLSTNPSEADYSQISICMAYALNATYTGVLNTVTCTLSGAPEYSQICISEFRNGADDQQLNQVIALDQISNNTATGTDITPVSGTVTPQTVDQVLVCAMFSDYGSSIVDGYPVGTGWTICDGSDAGPASWAQQYQVQTNIVQSTGNFLQQPDTQTYVASQLTFSLTNPSPPVPGVLPPYPPPLSTYLKTYDRGQIAYFFQSLTSTNGPATISTYGNALAVPPGSTAWAVPPCKLIEGTMQDVMIQIDGYGATKTSGPQAVVEIYGSIDGGLFYPIATLATANTTGNLYSLAQLITSGVKPKYITAGVTAYGGSGGTSDSVTASMFA